MPLLKTGRRLLQDGGAHITAENNGIQIDMSLAGNDGIRCPDASLEADGSLLIVL